MVDMVKGEKICYNEPNNKLAMWCKALRTKLKIEFEKLIEGVIVKEEMKDKIVDEVEKYSDDLEYVEDYINIKTALSDPHGMAVTRSFALEHLGKECPIGEEMTYELQRVVDGRAEYYDKTFKILAVIDDRIPGFLQYNHQ